MRALYRAEYSRLSETEVVPYEKLARDHNQRHAVIKDACVDALIESELATFVNKFSEGII
jgi:hypothetical protein